jgi:hypothetical protein
MHHIRANLEMDSHDEKLHNMIMETKMSEARDQMKRKAKAIRQQKRDQARSSRSESTGFGGSSGGFGGGFGSDSAPQSGGFEGGMGGGGSGMGGGGPPSQADFFNASRPKAAAASTIAIPKRAGMQLGARKGGKTKQSAFLAQMSKEEGIDVSAAAATRAPAEASRGAAVQAAPGVAAMPLMILAREELTVRCGRDGGLKSLDLKGFLFLTANTPDATSPVVSLAQGDNSGFQCQANPHVDRKTWTRGSAIQGKHADRALLQEGKETSVLRWRLQGSDMGAKEALLPLVINCWPESNRGSMNVNVEYSLERPELELSEVVVTIPLRNGGTPQIVAQDGDRFHHDAREGVLTWHMDMITSENDVRGVAPPPSLPPSHTCRAVSRSPTTSPAPPSLPPPSQSGSLEFNIPGDSEDDFFPITVTFYSRTTAFQFELSGAAGPDGAPIRANVQRITSIESYEIE